MSQHFLVWMCSFYHTFEDNLCRMFCKADWRLLWWMWFSHLPAATSCLCCMKSARRDLKFDWDALCIFLSILQYCTCSSHNSKSLFGKRKTLLCLADACGRFGKSIAAPPVNYIINDWIIVLNCKIRLDLVNSDSLTTMCSCVPLRSLFTDKPIWIWVLTIWVEKPPLFKEWWK